MAMAIAINIIGAYIAVTIQFLFLDTIGTFIAAFLFGPLYGMVAGALTLLISGTLFDPTAYYFIPVQMLVGLLAGLFYKRQFFDREKPAKLAVGVLGTTVPASALAATIATIAFSGITSAGTSYIVIALKATGLSIFSASFLSQLPMDLLDKTIAVLIAIMIVKRLGVIGIYSRSNKK